MEYTNEALVMQIQSGASEKMEPLWLRLQDEVRLQSRQWAQRFRSRRPGVSAEDLYQCGYIALCRAVESFFPGGALPFTPWFLICLRLEFARAAGHRAIRVLDAMETEEPPPPLPKPLDAALNTLPKDLRQTLQLRYLLGLSQQETGLLLELRPSAVALQEKTALHQLREGPYSPALRSLYEDFTERICDT